MRGLTGLAVAVVALFAVTGAAAARSPHLRPVPGQAGRSHGGDEGSLCRPSDPFGRQGRPWRDRAGRASRARAPAVARPAHRGRPRAGGSSRRGSDQPARGGGVRSAAGERRVLRAARRPGGRTRHHGCGRGRLPLLRRPLLRVPSARRVRRAQRPGRRQGRHRHGAAGERVAGARGRAAGWRARLGVLLPLRRRPRTVDVGDGPVGRGAGVRASRFAPARRRPCADARGDGGVQGGSHADDESRRGTLDPPLLLQLAGGSERAAAVGALTPDVRDGDGRRDGGDARLAAGAVGRGERVSLRHGLLDVLLARRRAHAALVPEVHRPAVAEARAAGSAFRGGGCQLCGVPQAAACVQAREYVPWGASLLALEAVPRDRVDAVGPGTLAAPEPSRRLAHASLERRPSAPGSTPFT